MKGLISPKKEAVCLLADKNQYKRNGKRHEGLEGKCMFRDTGE